jgi:enamine deaminase RidA (YjgF/YER057c/UK114 family)
MQRWLFRTAATLCFVSALAPSVYAGHKKKNEEPKPQVLPLPKELPRVLPADTRVLSFRTTPLLKSGRLSAQTRETLNGLIRDTRGATIVKLRAFVAGVGDSRRVQEMVSEMFTDKKLPLPVLTIVQVGGLGEDSSAVVIEAISAERKPVNPNGLVFISGETGSSLEASLTQVSEKSKSAGLAPSDVLSATCFTSRVNNYPGMHAAMAAAFPQASLNLVQALRDPMDSRTTCEAIGRIPSGDATARASLPPGSRIAIVTAPQVVFTGLQLSFGTFLDDADSALSRLSRDAEAVHADLRSAVSFNAFSLSPAAVSALQKTMTKFNLPANALTVQPVEGLPSLDAALGMEAVLVPAGASATDARREDPGFSNGLLPR